MGAHTTLDITREDCLKEILAKILSADDNKLASIAFDLFGDEQLYNFNVVRHYDPSNKHYNWDYRNGNYDAYPED
jgi:hypothetical protein